MSKFQAIPGPFGSIDERKTTEAFEEYVGGVNRAQRLLHIRQNSYPSGKCTAQEMFEAKARQEGFSQEELDAFHTLR